ncbi:MAG: hypothetical protein IPN53_01275 [Comamonadaceae bacterium]|nr:hypothetical protein [Comamonadaceae bacterium]
MHTLGLEGAWATWLTGQYTENVSYPLTPWIIFTLIGVIVGKLRSQYDAQLMSRVFLVAAALSFTASLGMHLYGHNFSRWGTMNSGYFVFAIATLAITYFLANRLSVQYCSEKLSLNVDGPTSFMVVAVHYFFVQVLGVIIPEASVYILLVVLIVVTLSVSKQAVKRVYSLLDHDHYGKKIYLLLVVFSISAAGCYYFSTISKLVSSMFLLLAHVVILTFLLYQKTNK